MAGINDLILYPSPGGIPENITLGVPTPAVREARPILVLNDNTIAGVNGIVLSPPRVEDISGPVTIFQPLLGLRATLAGGILFPQLAQLLGQSATTAQGIIVPITGESIGDMVLNDPGIPDTKIFLWASGERDSVQNHRNAALTGQLATALAGDAVGVGGAVGVLVGLAATTAGGLLAKKVHHQLFIDNFTDTNGVQITSHTGDTPAFATWTTGFTGGGTVPLVNTNRMRANSADWRGYVNWIPPYHDYYLEGFIKRNSNSASGVVDLIDTGIIARQSTNGLNGYVFGWSSNDGSLPRWSLQRINSGTFVEIASSTTNPINAIGSGQPEERTVRMYMTNVSGAVVNITCLVDDVEVINFDDSSGNRLDGTAADRVGAMFSNFSSFDLDWISTWGDWRLLTGQRATLAQGIFGPFGVVLVGQAATAIGGTLIPSLDLSVALVGNAASALGGVPVPTHLMGDSTGVHAGVLIPKLAVTNLYVGNNGLPGYVTNSYFVGAAGGKRAMAEAFAAPIHTFAVYDPDVGPAGATFLSTYFGLNTSGALSADGRWRYTSEVNPGGTFAIDQDGVIHVGTYRQLNTPLTTVHSLTNYMAWSSTSGAAYNNPTLLLGRAHGAHPTDWLAPYALAALGIYGIDANHVIAFHYRRINTQISGPHIELCGLRATTARGALAATFVGNPELVGARAVTAAGVLTRNPAQAGASATIELTGQRANANSSQTSLINTVKPVNSQDTMAIAISRATYGDLGWSHAANITSVTGGSRVFPKPNILCIVPTGYGSKLYVVYVNEPPESASPYIGVAVFDNATSTVIANTNTVTVGRVDSARADLGLHMRQERSVADVVRLGSGTSVTQFLLDRHVVHLSWTSGTVDTPTVTVKVGPTVAGALGSPPEQLIGGWESLEKRGDEVYHVLYRYITDNAFGRKYESVGKIFVNDATGTGGSWTLTTVTNSGAAVAAGPSGWSDFYILATEDGFYNAGSNFSGYGRGDSWLYVDRHHDKGAGTNSDYATVAVDFWDAQQFIYSIQMSGRVGQVGVNITPNVALTGLRATASPGTFLGITSGADVTRQLVGRRATTAIGVLEPPVISFVLDTYTDIVFTDLTAHTGEVGATWSRIFPISQSQFEINSNAAKMRFQSASNLQNIAIASGVAPTRNYRVNARVTYGHSGVFTPGQPELSIGVRCTGPYGYWFGHAANENLWYLLKVNGLGQQTLATYSQVLSGAVDIRLDIDRDAYEPRLRCYVSGVLVIEYTDNVHEIDSPIDNGGVGIWGYGFDTGTASIDSINAEYIDPTAFIITGLRADALAGQLQVFGATLTGLAAVATAGQIQADTSLTGLAATMAQGILTAVGGSVSAALTGNAATMAGGVMVPDVGATIVGQAATGMQGALVPVHATPLVGQGAVTASGTMTQLTEVFLQLTGLRATMAQGALTATPLNVVALTGLAASVVQGQPVPGIDKDIVGRRAASAPGVVVSEVSPVPLGRAATATGGVLVPLVDITLTGRRATFAQGVFTIHADCNLFPTGVQAIGRIGPYTTNVPKPTPDQQSWVRQESQRLFATVSPSNNVLWVRQAPAVASVTFLQVRLDQQTWARVEVKQIAAVVTPEE